LEDYVVIDIRGNLFPLDPRSKIIITFSCIIGIAVSIDFFQVLLFACMLLPIIIFYRPKRSAINRIFLTIPFALLFCLSIYVFLDGNSVTLRYISYKRIYTDFEFSVLVGYRFLISVAHSTILLESEETYLEIIEALASFKVGRYLVSLLILILTISNRLSSEYSRMTLVAKAKGGFSQKSTTSIFLKLRIMSRLLARTINNYSVAETLSARGFTGTFYPTTRNWSSEGISMALLSILFSILFVFIGELRMIYHG